jgi:hypothetical protein
LSRNIIQKIALSQEFETSVYNSRTKAFKCRCAYARSAETQAVGDVGQDYLVFGQRGESIAFAVCDGVSLSFFGNLAAHILGEALVEWLLTGLPATLEKKTIGTSLKHLLLSTTRSATLAVQDYALSARMPAMLRDVLEEKRAKGSESTFVCGRLDPPGKKFPNGRAVFAWLGDSRLRLWGENGELTGILGGTFETAQRWSTLTGPVGREPHLFVAPIIGSERLVRFAAYTDGLAALDDFDTIISNSEIQDLIDSTLKAATSDDVAYIEIITANKKWPESQGEISSGRVTIRNERAAPLPPEVDITAKKELPLQAAEAGPPVKAEGYFVPQYQNDPECEVKAADFTGADLVAEDKVSTGNNKAKIYLCVALAAVLLIAAAFGFGNILHERFQLGAGYFDSSGPKAQNDATVPEKDFQVVIPAYEDTILKNAYGTGR